MRISSKGRYGLAAMISLAQSFQNNENITIIRISEKLGISKIYLEQVFALLKRSELVIAIKGAQGGYQLAKSPEQISVYDILNAAERSIFEKTEESVADKAEAIEKAMKSVVWNHMDETLYKTMQKITLRDLVDEVEKNNNAENIMFYI